MRIFLLIILFLMPNEVLAGNCDKLVDKIKNCEKYACHIQHQLSDFVIKHRIYGKTPNGKCHYTQTIPVPPNAPNELLMNCLFDKNILVPYSNVIKQSLGLRDSYPEDEKIVNEALAQDICVIEGI